MRAVHVSSPSLGLSGICDVVEFENDASGNIKSILPIEYKVGHKKNGDYDLVQLCAEAIALEETYSIHISVGCLYYGQERRRNLVDIDDDLRARTSELSSEMHECFTSGNVPPAVKGQKCKGCSLFDLCLPKEPDQSDVRSYMSAIRGD